MGGVKDSGRLVVWVGFVSFLIAIAYASRAAGGKPEPNVVYTWSFGLESLGGYAIFALAVALISFGKTELLAVRRPRSWPRALGLSLAVVVAVLVFGGILESYLHAGEEQGITPTRWEGDRAGAFAFSFFVLVVVGPAIEELLFRGLGYSLLEFLTPWPAITFVGLSFGLSHGLVAGLPILAAFGMALAWLRWRTVSVLPGILVHGAFNAIALIASVST